MSLRHEHQQLGKDHTNLAMDHLRLTEDHHNLRADYSRDVNRLLARNHQQEAMLQAADAMHQKLEGALGKVMTLLQRHLQAGDSHVPARALWHVLHDAGFTTAPKPNLTHTEQMALKNAPQQEQKKEQKQTQQPEAQQKQTQHRGMRI
jgi:hypothetical protein